jgi:hypothetical protein
MFTSDDLAAVVRTAPFSVAAGDSRDDVCKGDDSAPSTCCAGRARSRTPVASPLVGLACLLQPQPRELPLSSSCSLPASNAADVQSDLQPAGGTSINLSATQSAQQQVVLQLLPLPLPSAPPSPSLGSHGSPIGIDSVEVWARQLTPLPWAADWDTLAANADTSRLRTSTLPKAMGVVDRKRRAGARRQAEYASRFKMMASTVTLAQLENRSLRRRCHQG